MKINIKNLEDQINKIFDNKYNFKYKNRYISSPTTVEYYFDYNGVEICMLFECMEFSIISFTLYGANYNEFDNREYFYDIDEYRTGLSKEGIHFIESNIK